MGSLLAETIEAEKIEKLVKPVKHLFAAIFFVSVGMMIQPDLLIEYLIPICILTILVIVGQVFFGSLGILLSGQSLKIALQSGFSLTQVGEFAFIIASLGVSLKVTDDYLYPVIVAVSVVTTFLTPYMIRLAIPTYQLIENEIYVTGCNTIYSIDNIQHHPIFHLYKSDYSRKHIWNQRGFIELIYYSGCYIAFPLGHHYEKESFS